MFEMDSALWSFTIEETGYPLFAIYVEKTLNPRKTTLLSYTVLNSPAIGEATENAMTSARSARAYSYLDPKRTFMTQFLCCRAAYQTSRSPRAQYQLVNELRTKVLKP